jgi:hypothetical protein
MRDNPPGFLSSGRSAALLFFPLFGLIESLPRCHELVVIWKGQVAARLNLAAHATLVSS